MRKRGDHLVSGILVRLDRAGRPRAAVHKAMKKTGSARPGSRGSAGKSIVVASKGFLELWSQLPVRVTDGKVAMDVLWRRVSYNLIEHHWSPQVSHMIASGTKNQSIGDRQP